MKNKKLMQALVVGASIFALAGCGTSNDAETKGDRITKDISIENDITEPDKKDTSDENDSNAVGSMDGGEMIAASDLQGSVIEFSDNGCTINSVTTDSDGDGGSTSVIAADGHEDESAKVTIKYGDNCTFQRAVIGIKTGNAAVSVAGKSDIKKKASLLLYGSFDDTENFTAAKVVIAQYEQEE